MGDGRLSVVVGEIPEPVDLLVVGGGPAGYVGAIRGAGLGRRVLLVDRRGGAGLGGACLHTACIPSKALIEVADAAHRIDEWRAAGLTGGAAVDLAAWQRWRADLVEGLRAGIHQLMRAAGVAVLAGEVHFTRPDQAVVDIPGSVPHFYEFADVLIATGSRPAHPAGLAPDGRRTLSTDQLLAQDRIPPRLAVVGAGCAGIELATAFAKLGSRVTVIEAAEHLLPALDATLSRPVHRRLRSLGVQVLTGAAARGDDGESVAVETATGIRHVAADAVLVATGRTPNTDQLGLDRLGIAPGPQGHLPVDADRRLTRHAGAAGDVTPGPAVAHAASAEALVAVAALSGQRVAYQPAAVPVTVFADPQVATVGLTAAQARAEGIDVAQADVPLAASGRARTMHAAVGTMRLVTDKVDGTVLGVHIAGPQAAEIIGAATMAIEMGANVADLAHLVLPHPTLGEQLVDAAQLALGLPIQVPATGRATRP